MKKIIYLGFNGFIDHKRGVENVIEFQSSVFNDFCYYIHWGDNNKVYKYKSFVCFSVNKRSWLKFVVINQLIHRLKKKNKNNVFIHSHNVLMSFFLKCNSDLFTVHDGLYYQNKEIGVGKLKLILFYCLEKWLYRKCRSVHFISEFTKKNSLYTGYPVHAELIYNTSNFESQARNYEFKENEFTNKYPFLSLNHYCFLVRSIEERVRMDLVLDLAQKRQDINFVVAGKGALLEYYKKRICERNIQNLFLLGFVQDEELFMLYIGASFVMVPAEYGEGFGLPIIEGYLFNKPVVASAKCAIPEVILNDIYLFENHVGAMSDAIDNLFSLQRENYKAYYDLKFSNHVILNQYLNLYRQCMN